ncbi:hypothetical protein BASA60_009646 [Batrachochytrium salamandrivorans]|nr:hypothetical protein BASA60_009646 [Batrachochytrium salamandrivorans]KAH6577900.1 hypothetical protein BASA62_000607 [Batrachochytrium salamandrivorans]
MSTVARQRLRASLRSGNPVSILSELEFYFTTPIDKSAASDAKDAPSSRKISPRPSLPAVLPRLFLKDVMQGSPDPVGLLLDIANAALFNTEGMNIKRMIYMGLGGSIARIYAAVDPQWSATDQYFRQTTGNPLSSLQASSPNPSSMVSLTAADNINSISNEGKKRATIQMDLSESDNTDDDCYAEPNTHISKWIHSKYQSKWSDFCAHHISQRHKNAQRVVQMLKEPAANPFALWLAEPFSIHFLPPADATRNSRASLDVGSGTSLDKAPVTLAFHHVDKLISRLQKADAMAEIVNLVTKSQLQNYVRLNSIMIRLLNKQDTKLLVELVKDHLPLRYQLYELVERPWQEAISHLRSPSNDSRVWVKPCSKVMKIVDQADEAYFPSLVVGRRYGAFGFSLREVRDGFKLQHTSPNMMYTDMDDCLLDSVELAVRSLSAESERNALCSDESALPFKRSVPRVTSGEVTAFLLKETFQHFTNISIKALLRHRFKDLIWIHPQFAGPSKSARPVNSTSYLHNSTLIPFYTSSAPVTFINDTAGLKEFSETIPEIVTIGVDGEWYNQTADGISIFQIAALDNKGTCHAYILDMLNLDRDRMCEVLSKLFQSSHLTVLGFDASQDLSKLTALMPKMVHPRNLVDLSTLSLAAFQKTLEDHQLQNKKQYSLADLSLVILKKTLDKRVRLSWWDKRPLRQCQLLYAGLGNRAVADGDITSCDMQV